MLASEVVEKALRRLDVVAVDESAQPADIATGVAALNEMIFGWKARSCDVLHVELAPSDPLALPVEFHAGVIDLLAMRLGPDYGRPAPDATHWFRVIQAAYLDTTEATFDRALTYLPTRRVLRLTGF